MSDELSPYEPPKAELETERTEWNLAGLADHLLVGFICSFIGGVTGGFLAPVTLIFICILVGDFGGIFGFLITAALASFLGAVCGSVAGLVIGVSHCALSSRARCTARF